MESITITIIIGLAVLFLNLFLTHMRVVKWISDKARWIIAVTLLILGLIGFLLADRLVNIEQRVFASLCTTFVLTIIDRIFRYLSIKKQGRDFYFNTSFEWLINQYKEKFSTLDQIMTVTMLLIIFGLEIITIAWKVN